MGKQFRQTEKIEIRIPKEILNFVKALSDFAKLDVEAYLSKIIVDSVMADIDSLGASALLSPEEIKEKYGLDKLEE